MAWSISNAMMRNYESLSYSRERGGASLPTNYSDGEPSALSNTTPMPDQYYWPDRTTEHSRLSRFGMTCERLTENLGAELLIWYLAGFHARTSAHRATDRESTEKPAGYGAKCGGLLATYSRDMSAWKTAQCSLLADSDEFSETWPRWGSMRSGDAYQAGVSAPTMYEIESGSLLPTPTCHNSKEGAYPAEYTRNTPTLATHVGGKIHPNFTEWMMRWPLDWTDLKPLATGKFRSWRLQHGESYPVSHDPRR